MRGGDRQITIKWASNREPDLVEYRVYRTDKEEATRDLRLMTLVHTEAVPSADPSSRPAEVVWTDAPVSGLTTLYYQLVAVDDAGNVSIPSPTLTGRAFDDSRPDPPTWNLPAPGATPDEIVLSWSSAILDLRCLVQRRRVGTTLWESVSTWLARGMYSYTDSDRSPILQYDYRLRVMDNAKKDKFKLFDFFANCEYFEEKFNYDEGLKLPVKPSIGEREQTETADTIIIDGYENFNPDPLRTLEETVIGLEGMKIDRKLFERFEDRVKSDASYTGPELRLRKRP